MTIRRTIAHRAFEVDVLESAAGPDPREHGRQAARSKRDRPEAGTRADYQISHVSAAVGGALRSP